jgi:hypothetical protein
MKKKNNQPNIIASLPVPTHERFTVGGESALMFKIAKLCSDTVMDDRCACFLDYKFVSLQSLVERYYPGDGGRELEEAVCIARCYFEDEAEKSRNGSQAGSKHDEFKKKAFLWLEFYEKVKNDFQNRP